MSGLLWGAVELSSIGMGLFTDPLDLTGVVNNLLPRIGDGYGATCRPSSMYCEVFGDVVGLSGVQHLMLGSM